LCKSFFWEKELKRKNPFSFFISLCTNSLCPSTQPARAKRGRAFNRTEIFGGRAFFCPPFFSGFFSGVRRAGLFLGRQFFLFIFGFFSDFFLMEKKGKNPKKNPNF